MASAAFRLSRLAGFLGAATATAGVGIGAGALTTAGGPLQPSGGLAMNYTARAEAAPPSTGALNPNEFRAFKLIKKENVTKNTNLYRFELPDNQVSGIFTASCLVTKVVMKEKPEDEAPKPIVRPYTPVSTPDTKGYLDLVVKIYPTGKMGRHIDSLKIGDTLEMKGPIPKYPYKPNIKKAIGMVAGGSGITPMMQVIDTVLANPDDKTQLSLIYGNLTEADIIMKDKIDGWAKQHPDRFKVYYVVDKPSWAGLAWKGGVGYITKDMVQQHLPGPAKDSLIMVCGPPGLMAAISGGKAPDYSQGEVSGILKELGYTKDNVFKF